MPEELRGIRGTVAGMRENTASALNARSGFWIALVVFACLCLVAALRHHQRITTTVRRAFSVAPVFANGSKGYHCFRIPAIVQAPDGTLLAFAEGRKYDCNDFGDIQIVMRRSQDGGKHWSPLAVVASNRNLQTGNPAPVVETMDTRYPQGRIFLFYTTANISEDDLAKGRGSTHVWYRASTDSGTTWAPPVEITDSVKLPNWGNYGTGPGHALELSSGPYRGRIFVPGFHSEGATRQDQTEARAQGFFSDDHGQTWRLGASASPTSSESTAAQAADSSLVMNSRDESGTSKSRIISISTSGGEHWEKTIVARDLPDPVCEGSMVSFAPPGRAPVLLFSNLLNTNPDRHGLTVSESTDGGGSWPMHKVIYKDGSAYSDLVVMSGGVLGILFERESDGIVFETRRIADLF
jgi:sialidase-1